MNAFCGEIVDVDFKMFNEYCVDVDKNMLQYFLQFLLYSFNEFSKVELIVFK